MCGIAGFVARPGQRMPEGLAGRLAAALAHRGPDGVGIRHVGDTLLVNRRLAIIDVAGGAQPLVAPDGTALIANAEIYDYVERRAALGETRFASGSDCEVPLALYRARGGAFADDLRGMYAIAVHDPMRARLVLARDPFGIKPLYIAETEHGLAFASEIGALVAAGLAVRRLNATARDELLALQFTCGGETVIEGVRRVLPGETIVVSQGRIVERRRRPALPEGGPTAWSEAEALERFDAVWAESVALHRRSDVPYGIFLSGGLDSGAVLAAMARQGLDGVTAFTIAFSGADARDEAAEAARAAAAAGARHVAVPFGEDDFWSLLPGTVAALDDPVADYAAVPTYKLAAEAARVVKAVLTGEGGDELFAGYGRYRSALRPWWLAGRAARRRAALAGLGVLRTEPTVWRDGIAAARALAATPGRTALQVEQATEVAEWLHADLLTKVDRCLMAHGLEGRTPFLDPAVAAFAFALPDALKVRGRMGKWLLRRWLDRQAPAARSFAAKRGFTVPVGMWIARRADTLGPMVARSPALAELCRPEPVAALFRAAARKRHGMAAWMLLFYALWHRHHVEGRPLAGDVVDALGGT
ncbi:MAG: asparagine synthase (glutamine-hydrolyzing) [Alphaproteobacteria bacterium]|nr:asparagine synthase (glutamine-hydrolyzing) [Alphaproteobacteria bacterium]